MKKYTFVLLIILIISLTLDNTTSAKEKQPSSKQKKKNASAEVADASPIVPFDIKAEKLPPNYKGTDIIKLYSMIAKKAPLHKKEFETTAEYETKIASALSAISDNIYAFKLEPQACIGYVYGVHIKPYDADAQKFIISLESDSDLFSATFIVKRLDKGSNSYIGSNAFGAKRLVTNYRETQYGIALVNTQDFGSSTSDWKKNNRQLTIEIKLPPDKARALKNNIGVLLLCKPSLYKSYEGNTLIFEDPYYDEATIDNPASFSFDRKYIHVELLAIWIYDFRTGELIFKKQLKDKDKEKQGKEVE